MKTKNVEYCNKMTDKYYHKLVLDFNMTICIAVISFASIAGTIFYKVLPFWLQLLIIITTIILLIIVICEKRQVLLRIIRAVSYTHLQYSKWRVKMHCHQLNLTAVPPGRRQ